MERFSALLVPSYLLSFEPDEDDIVSLGLGVSYSIFESVSLMIEWFPVLSGEIPGFSTWSVGIGKHLAGLWLEARSFPPRESGTG